MHIHEESYEFSKNFHWREDRHSHLVHEYIKLFTTEENILHYLYKSIASLYFYLS